jgi:hypothetical protein
LREIADVRGEHGGLSHLARRQLSGDGDRFQQHPFERTLPNFTEEQLAQKPAFLWSRAAGQPAEFDHASFGRPLATLGCQEG